MQDELKSQRLDFELALDELKTPVQPDPTDMRRSQNRRIRPARNRMTSGPCHRSPLCSGPYTISVFGISLLAILTVSVPTVRPLAAQPRGDFVVSPNGDDTNPGTAAAPFATLRRAQQAVRERLASGIDQDLTILIRSGTYRLTEPLVFGPEDGGDEEHAVLYTAAPNETVTISGGRTIDGWHTDERGTWSTTLPEVRSERWTFRELFVNGERRQRAREPNDGYFRVVEAGPDKRTSFTFRPGDIPEDGAVGAELVFLHDWSTSRVRIASVDGADHVVKLADPIGPAADHYEIDHFEPHPRYFLENSRAFLDVPGEWFLDEKRGVLTYRPLPDESIEEIEAVAPVAERLLVVRGTEEAPVRNLHFRGLIFRHCNWQIPETGYAAGQAGYHERRDAPSGGTLREPVPAALLFERAEGCRFENGRIEHLGTSGIRLGRECRDCVLSGTAVSDVAGNGVLIGEDRNRKVEGRPWWQHVPEQAARGNRVTDCLVERCGAEFYGAVGLWIGMAHHTTAAHNRICNLPYTGVSVGWMWNPTPTPCHHNRIEHNHIHDVMQVLSDGGGIYTLGRQPGTVLRGNRIHSVPLNLGRAESNGMFLDEGTTEILIEENLIYDVERSPLRFHQAGENLVRNNRLVIQKDVPPVRYNATPEKNIRLENNTIQMADEFDVSQAEVLLPAAGLRSPHRERLQNSNRK